MKGIFAVWSPLRQRKNRFAAALLIYWLSLYSAYWLSETPSFCDSWASLRCRTITRAAVKFQNAAYILMKGSLQRKLLSLRMLYGEYYQIWTKGVFDYVSQVGDAPHLRTVSERVVAKHGFDFFWSIQNHVRSQTCFSILKRPYIPTKCCKPILKSSSLSKALSCAMTSQLFAHFVCC